MKILFQIILIHIITINYTLNSQANQIEGHKIVILVNDEMITSYEIIQRMKMNAIIEGIEITEDNQLLLQKRTEEELIREKLKYQKSYEYDIKVNQEEYINYETDFLEKRNIDKKLLNSIFLENKINYLEFKNYLITDYAWLKLLGKLYYRLSSASEIEIEEIIKRNPNISFEQAKDFAIQRQIELKGNKLLRDMMNEATIEYK
ncbi:MAG: hypothetical protein CMD36_00205 [Flavobacteriales bacterium]|nr:hypothetical protein [Flavobacteriales bacterium]